MGGGVFERNCAVSQEFGDSAGQVVSISDGTISSYGNGKKL